jgi:hypothetical protein
MTDLPSNPYVSPCSFRVDSGRRRPIGTIAFATLLLLFGLALGGGGAIRFVQTWTIDRPIAYSSFATLGIVAIAAVGASVGLLSGHRLGWWMAIGFCYVGFAAFVLLPIVYSGVGYRPTRRAVIGSVLLFYWFYLHRMNVRAYFDQTGPRRWRIQIGLFVLSVLVVFALNL